MGKILSQIVKEAQKDYNNSIILVKVNGTLQEISDAVVEPESVEFITTSTSIGNETYRRSVVLLMLDAVYKTAGKENIDEVSVEYSISKGLYCNIHGSVKVTREFLDKVKKKMLEIAGEDKPIKKTLMKTRDAVALFKKHGMEDKTQPM